MGKYEVIEDWQDRKKIVKIGMIVLFILLLLGSGGYYFYIQNKDPKVIEGDLMELAPPKEEKPAEKMWEVMIDIKGEVNHPGTYRVTENKRIIEIIELAGGVTEKADTSLLNLSKKVKDEMVIIIYNKEQVKNNQGKKEEEILQKCPTIEENIKNDACTSKEQQEPKLEGSTEQSSKVSLNSATKEQLMTLPGIGLSKAEDILAYRMKNGFFQTIEELKNIKGIGDNIFDQIKENITL